MKLRKKFNPKWCIAISICTLYTIPEILQVLHSAKYYLYVTVSKLQGVSAVVWVFCLFSQIVLASQQSFKTKQKEKKSNNNNNYNYDDNKKRHDWKQLVIFTALHEEISIKMAYGGIVQMILWICSQSTLGCTRTRSLDQPYSGHAVSLQRVLLPLAINHNPLAAKCFPS